jgi:hypothetical protein
MSQLEGASYRIRFPGPYLAESGWSLDRLREVIEARVPELLRRDHVIVRRRNEAQTREFDARPSIVSLATGSENEVPVLDAQIRFTARAQVRPDELLALLVPNADARSADVERVTLWAEPGGLRLDPLALLDAPMIEPASHGVSMRTA